MSDPILRWTCYRCMMGFRVSSERTGERLRCPECGLLFQVGHAHGVPLVIVSVPTNPPTFSGARS